jgi:hypothetical protein
MPLACKICILKKGLSGSEVSSLPKTDEELYEHLESEHQLIVLREGEDREAAKKRYYEKYPARRPII